MHVENIRGLDGPIREQAPADIRTTTMKRSTLRSLVRPFALAVSLLLLSTSPASAARQVIVDLAALRALPQEQQLHVLDLRCRLEEILATDRSALPSAERKALRTEFRAMKKEMERLNSGGTVIYLSTGAIIIILLLIILL